MSGVLKNYFYDGKLYMVLHKEESTRLIYFDIEALFAVESIKKEK